MCAKYFEELATVLAGVNPAEPKLIDLKP